MSHIDQERITRALLKFLEEHEHGHDKGMELIRSCLSNLENDSADEAAKDYKKFMSSCGLGRMGAFDDNFCSTVYDHETDEYVNELRKCLLSMWSIKMSLLLNKNS